jgi:hypothetical protein
MRAEAAVAQLLQRFEGEKRIQSDCLLAIVAAVFALILPLQVFTSFWNVFDADDDEEDADNDADDQSVLKLQNPDLRLGAGGPLGGGPRDGMDDADHDHYHVSEWL